MKFTKMHGLGNDFVVLDAVNQPITLSAKQIRSMADRHCGIGFDQLLLVQPPSAADVDFDYRIYNADGGEVGQCGNGARCLARFIQQQGLSDKTELAVATKTCTMQLQLLDDDLVAVSLGVPEVEVDLTAELTGQRVDYVSVDVGNPHAVMTVASAAEAAVATIGAEMTRYRAFPDGANVGFMEIQSPQSINLRVFERGVGETAACGSGACAAVVAGRSRGQLAETVTVALPGGELQVRWSGDGENVWLIGPAETVYTGVWGEINE